MTLEELLRYSAPAGKLASGLGSILDQPGLKDVGAGFGGVEGLYNLGAGIAGGNPSQALGGASGIFNLATQIPGLESLGSAVPYVGGLMSLFKLGQQGAAGDWGSMAASLPGLAGSAGALAGTGALGGAMAAAAPALTSIGGFALPAAAAAYFAMNNQRKDAERRMNEVKEWQTAKRDLPTTLRQTQGALAAHQGYEDPGALTDEQLRNLAGQTQTGLLAQNPLGHSLMQLGAGEEFAGIKGTDISKPQRFTQAATPIIAHDYLTAADEFAKRGLTLGGDAKTAMHGSIYDSPEEQWKVNAPDAAQMLKSWAIQYAPDSAEAKKVNQLLDASRQGTAEGGQIEKLAIPGFEKGNYQKAFEDYTKNILTQPVAPPTAPAEDPMWAGGVYRGPNPNEYRPYGG